MRELLRSHREQIIDLRTERDRLLGQVKTAHRLLTDQHARLGLLAWFFRKAIDFVPAVRTSRNMLDVRITESLVCFGRSSFEPGS